MIMPAALILFLFAYLPYPGLIVAFQSFNFVDKFKSPFVGLDNFKFYFTSTYAFRTTFYTIFININYLFWTTVFWLSIDGQFHKADEYETLPYGSIFRYKLPGGINLRRFRFSPDEVKGLSIRYTFENPTGEEKNLKLKFITRFDLLPVWFSKESGILDDEDSASYDAANQVIVARDQGHDW